MAPSAGSGWAGRRATAAAHPPERVGGRLQGRAAGSTVDSAKVRLVDMGASAHLRWVAIVAAASLAAAVPAGAQEPASPDAAPSGSSAPRPDPAPVKTKPRVVVRAAPRPSATVTTTTVKPSAPAATTQRRSPAASRPARRATTHRATSHHQGGPPSQEARGARRAAAAPAPDPRAAQRTREHRRRRPCAQARRRRAVAADPRAGERDAPGLHRARRAQAGGAVRRALLLAVVALRSGRRRAAALRTVITPSRLRNGRRQRLVRQQRDRQLDRQRRVRGADRQTRLRSDDVSPPTPPGTSVDVLGHQQLIGRPAIAAHHIRRDATPPSVIRQRGPPRRRRRLLQPPAHGQRGLGSTPTSGIASCTSTPYSGPDGTGISLTGTCKDKAGNVSPPVPFVFNYDATPPALTSVTAVPDDAGARLAWQASGAATVTVMRSPAGARAAQSEVVYDGTGDAFTDTGLKNGTRYTYLVQAADLAGNTATGSATVTPTADASTKHLLSPGAGSSLSRPPLLRWRKVARASYYNVQLFRNGRKILSAWPTRPQYQLRSRWRYRRRAPPARARQLPVAAVGRLRPPQRAPLRPAAGQAHVRRSLTPATMPACAACMSTSTGRCWAPAGR